MINSVDMSQVEKIMFYFKNCSELVMHAKNGNVTKVQELIKAGGNIHYDSDAALHHSVTNGHTEVVIALLENGANMYANNNILLKGIQNNKLETVRVLLDHGASMHSINSHSPTSSPDMSLRGTRNCEDYEALLLSAERGNVEMVKLLLQHDTSIPQSAINIALGCAATSGNVEIIEILLECGADVHWGNDRAFQNSTQEHKLDAMIKLLENGANVHAEDDSALKINARRGCIDMVTALLEYGANVHAGDDQALQLSAENGHLAVVIKLLENGANVHANNHQVLMNSINNNRMDIFQILLQHGADIQATIDVAFVLSAMKGHLDLAIELLDRGVDINAFEGSALCYSIVNGHFDLVLKLLSSGADIKFIDKNFALACSQIKEWSYQNTCNQSSIKIIELLFELNVSLDVLNCALEFYVWLNNYEAVTLLLEHGVDVCHADNAALKTSIANGCLLMVSKLIEYGANVLALTSDAFTNVVINFQIVAKLLECGVRVSILNGLDASRGRTDSLDFKIIAALLEYGVDSSICDNAALKYCVKHGNVELCEALLKGRINASEIDRLLINSITKGNLAIATILLDHGVTMLAMCGALNCAITHGHLDIVLTLLEKGADPSANNNNLIHRSVENGNLEIVVALLEHGANVDERALMLACEGGNRDCVAKLLAYNKDCNIELLFTQ